jgi:hypothetical protein
LRGRSSATLTALVAILLSGAPISAHRLDQYLQAARIDIEPARIWISVDLTPGVAIAAGVISEIDADGDGRLSADEAHAYGARVLRASEFRIDGARVEMRAKTVDCPSADAIRRGEGVIRLQAVAALRPLSDGRHRLLFRNSYRRDASAYLANALVPGDSRVAIVGQERNASQGELAIDFTVSAASSRRAIVLLLCAIGAIALVLARFLRLPHLWRLSTCHHVE